MPNKLTTEGVIERFTLFHLDRFDYSLVDYINCDTKVKIRCKEHGVFEQTPREHWNGSVGCKKCISQERSSRNHLRITARDDFIDKSKKKHNNKYDYSQTEYINAKTKVRIICKEHGEFEQLPNDHKNGSGCLLCANKTKSETQRMTANEFVRRSNEIHNSRYTYYNFTSISEPVDVLCQEHGMFRQKASDHLYGSGCKKCGDIESGRKQRLTQSEFIQKAVEKHDSIYDYSLVMYSTSKSKVDIICKKHGVFSQIAADHLQGRGCPTCGVYMQNKRSNAEIELFDWICRNFPGGEWQHSVRNIIDGELDIYSPVYNIAIEYNGLYWHSSGSKEDDRKKMSYHIDKTEQCVEQAIQLFHIFEHEDISIWKSIIRNAVGESRRIYARKCQVRIINDKFSTRDFLNENHLQGSCPHKVSIGLFYENELVSLMSFGNSRYNKDIQWEILRFCNKKNLTIVGGASKILSTFRKLHRGSIVSYANKRLSNGILYEKLGFEHKHDSQACYWYIKDKQFHHRSRFMKHKLKEQLDIFDENKSEVENMYENGYRRIWDCGTKVYILK